jgi:hypothetical protein
MWKRTEPFIFYSILLQARTWSTGISVAAAIALAGCGTKISSLKDGIPRISTTSDANTGFAPVVANLSLLNINEDTASGVISLSYTDLEGDAATACTVSNLNQLAVSTPCSCTAGSCTIGVTGLSNYNGPASFDFRVIAGGQASNTGTASLTIDPVADTPVAANISPAAFNEDTQSADITLSYSDGDGDVATACAISNLSNVTVTQACACAAGVCSVRVTGTANYNGSATFDYTVTAGGQTTAAATATLSITAVNDAPVAANITPANFAEDAQSGLITLSYTDTESDLATACTISNLSNVTVTQACACAAGVCTLKVTGTSNYNGAAGFDFTVTAGGQTSATASASFSITAVNDAPVAANITPAAFNEDVQSADITLSYTDAETDAATACTISNLSNVTVSQACACAAGVCTLRVTGTSNFNGTGGFDYTVTANGQTSAAASASFTITAVADAPVAANITPAAFNEDTQSGTITLSYTDAESDAATACTISNLSNVTVTSACACASGTCTLKVTGTANYNGAAGFDYTVTAGGQTSAAASASFSITAVADAPVAANITPAAFDEDVQSGVITLSYTDAESDAATACTISNLSNITVTQACACAAGTCTLKVTGTSNFNGTGGFDYTVTANSQTSAAASASFTINAVNDAPVAANITPTAFDEDVQSGVITLSYTDTESDAATACTISNLSGVTVTQACACASGTCTLKVTGTSNFNGTGSFDYTVTAGGQTSAAASASFTVNAVADTPLISNISNQTAYGTSAATVSFTISDAETAVACNSTYLTATSSDTALIPVANIVWSGTAPNCVATVTSTSNTGGSSTLQFTVTDGTLTANDSFTMYVRSILLSTTTVGKNSRIADFDADGYGDVAILGRTGGAPYANGVITIHYGNGDGTYDAAVLVTDTTLMLNDRYLEMADVNGDGKMDLLTNSGTGIKVYYNGGSNRVFTSPPTAHVLYTAGGGYTFENFAVADFNGDSRMDLINTHYYGTASNYFGVRLHDGSTSYATANWGTTASSEYRTTVGSVWVSDVTTGDFNEDGKLDIVTGITDQIRVYFGNGTTGISSTTTPLTGEGAANVECVGVGDMNGDGNQDIFMSFWNNKKATVLAGDGLGGFTAGSYDFPAANNQGCQVADLDKDGYSDFAVTSEAGDKLYIMYGSATGLSTASTQTINMTVAALSSEKIGVGDLNADGCDDLFVVYSGASTNGQIVYNKGPSGVAAQCLRTFHGP